VGPKKGCPPRQGGTKVSVRVGEEEGGGGRRGRGRGGVGGEKGRGESEGVPPRELYAALTAANFAPLFLRRTHVLQLLAEDAALFPARVTGSLVRFRVPAVGSRNEIGYRVVPVTGARRFFFFFFFSFFSTVCHRTGCHAFTLQYCQYSVTVCTAGCHV